MAQKKENRIKVRELTIEVRQGHNTKFMVFRNGRKDIPHLTISLGNPTKEIDVHLTTRTSGGQENYREISKIPESDFAKLYGSFEPDFLKSIDVNVRKIRKVRPGWLARKGYGILYLSDEAQDQLINKIAPTRKRKGKWECVIDVEALVNIHQLQEFTKYIFHPSALHDIAAQGCNGPVFAGCYRRRKRHLMSLRLVTKPNGRPYWIRTDHLARNLLSISGTFTLLCLKRLIPDGSWSLIRDELRLGEIGFDMAGA